MMIKKILFITILLSSPLLFFAQELIEAKTEIDWSKTTIEINVSVKLPQEINVLPEAKIQAANKIEDAVPVIIQLAMENVLLDSTQNVFERLKKDLKLTALIDNYSDSRYKTRTNLSPDLQRLKSSYKIPLYPDFCSTFIAHKVATPIRKLLFYVPSQDYTGIIIYASEELPIYGENKKGILTPSLFPKILNDNGEVIFQATNMAPEILKEKGVLHYVDNLDNVSIEEIGLLPLKIKATAIFGRNRCDIVIPTYLANKILARNSNINLLQTGKIIIVCDRDKLQSESFFRK